MKRSFTVCMLIVALMGFGCQSARQSRSVPQEVNTAVTEALPDSSAIAHKVKELARDTLDIDVSEVINRDFPDSLSQLARQSLPSFYTDTLEVVSQVKHYLEDTALVSEAAEYGKQQATNYLAGKYGIDPENIDPGKLDSTRLKEARELALSEANGYMTRELGDDYQLPTDSASRAVILEQSEKVLEKELSKNEYFGQMEEFLKEQQGILDAQQAALLAKKAEMEQYMNQKELKQKLTGAAKDFIREHATELQEVQTRMNDLKKVYSNVQNSEDLTEAVKQNSLEEESFGRRLVFGGNFNIGRTDPFSLDLSPLIGYRFNKLFTAGITGSYRAQFERHGSTLQNTDEEVYGYSVFAYHLVFRNFFGYMEGENKARVSDTENGRLTHWDQAWLIGIGREMKVSGSVKIQVMALYNVLYENNGLYGSPVVFKTGILIE